MKLLFSPWAQFSKKLIKRIDQPRSAGSFSQKEAAGKEMRLAVGAASHKEECISLTLYLLVDESDGIIADAKFKLFGPPALIGALDAACELVLRKNYEQARRFSVELIDK